MVLHLILGQMQMNTDAARILDLNGYAMFDCKTRWLDYLCKAKEEEEAQLADLSSAGVNIDTHERMELEVIKPC